MDLDDESGIFLFGHSAKKVEKLEEPLDMKEDMDEILPVPLDEPEAKNIPKWKAVKRIRRAFPVQPAKNKLTKVVIISGEEIVRWSQIYAKTDAEIQTRQAKLTKPKCRARKRTRKQRTQARISLTTAVYLGQGGSKADLKMTFDGANKYCEESIDKLQQLAHYVKERKKIEEEYAHSLSKHLDSIIGSIRIGKLCKTVSLRPFKKDDWFEESDKSSVTRTSLWRTFYEIIDDTAQISKSHDAFAESLKNSLLEPILASVKLQKEARKEIQYSAEDLVRKVNEAKELVKKSFRKYEEAFEKHAEYQAACERYNATGRIKDYDKMLTKVRAAKQKLDEASDRHEDAKANLDRMRSSVERTESPRLMAKMRELEAARMKGALAMVLELIELERRTACMDERYANEMGAKLKQIDLNADDQHFTRTHIDSGISTGAMVPLSMPPPPGIAVPQICTPKLMPCPSTEKLAADISQPPRYTHETTYPVVPEIIQDVIMPLPPAYSVEKLTLEPSTPLSYSELSRSLSQNLACSAVSFSCA